MTRLEWNVIIYDSNTNSIKNYNVFRNGRFYDNLKKLKSQHKTIDIKLLEESLADYIFEFWGRCEYEIAVSDVFGRIKPIKIDVHRQLLLNYRHFVDYIFNNWGEL